jgi:hypothetical protein
MKRPPGTVDIDAARQTVAFMRSLARRGSSPTGEKWSRESLYEDRMRRLNGRGKTLGAVKGWLADDDPFFAAVEKIVTSRSKHRPRTSGKPPKRQSRK